MPVLKGPVQWHRSASISGLRASPVLELQLDDLDGEALKRVGEAASLTLTTSPGNHQAWLAVSDIKEGEEVEAKFTGVDRKTRTISLSIKAKEVHEEAEAVSNYRSEQPTGGTTLGDLLKEQIGSER